MVQAPENGALGLRTFAGQALNANIRGDRTPYSMQWTFDIQHEIQGDMLIDVAYAGNSGVKLAAQAALNQLSDQYLALGDRLNDVVENPFFGIFPATSNLGARTNAIDADAHKRRGGPLAGTPRAHCRRLA